MTEVSRRELNRVAREREILDAALHVFAAAGFSGAAMEVVAQKAGISKPTLYQYFANKSELFDAMMRAKREDMVLAIERADPDQMVAQLFRFATRYAETVMRPDMLSLARLIIGEAERFPEIGRAYQAAGPERLLQDMQDYLIAQRNAGRLWFEDPELAAEDLWGLILSAPRNRALHDPDTPIPPATLSRFVHNGLRVFLRAYSTDVGKDMTDLSMIFHT